MDYSNDICKREAYLTAAFSIIVNILAFAVTTHIDTTSFYGYIIFVIPLMIIWIGIDIQAIRKTRNGVTPFIGQMLFVFLAVFFGEFYFFKLKNNVTGIVPFLILVFFLTIVYPIVSFKMTSLLAKVKGLPPKIKFAFIHNQSPGEKKDYSGKTAIFIVIQWSASLLAQVINTLG